MRKLPIDFVCVFYLLLAPVASEHGKSTESAQAILQREFSTSGFVTKNKNTKWPVIDTFI